MYTKVEIVHGAYKYSEFNNYPLFVYFVNPQLKGRPDEPCLPLPTNVT